ncbi:hypothetical protein TcWFU_008659 [Taenia crassiceps]|uniref:Uncharacterized protein n=1 Tax=Taenia crassiceps TaxID=6207 RepID=A0ABR4QEU5_9CEST
MAAVIGRFAAAGAKTGGKFATKTVTKKGGKGLAKGMGKMGKKKGLKKLIGGKDGKLKKFAESQLKGALMSKLDSGCDDEGPGSEGKQSKKPIQIKSPDRRSKSPGKKSGESPSSSKSKIGSKMQNYAKSKSHGSSRGRQGIDDDSECDGGTDDSDGERSRSRGRSKKRTKSGDSNLKSKRKTRDDKKDKKHKRHHSSEDESERTKNKGDKGRKDKKNNERKKKQRPDDNCSDRESEGTRKLEKRKGKKNGKRHSNQSLEDSLSETSDSEMVNGKKKQCKKGGNVRRVDSEDASDASDMECENVTEKGKRRDKKALSGKKKGKHDISGDDDEYTADEARKRNRRKWKHEKDKKSGRSDCSDASSDDEVCVSLRDIRFRKRNAMVYDRRGIDESDCCSRYTSPQTRMSMRELCKVIKEVSNGSGSVDVERLTKSLAQRACLTPKRTGGSRNAAGDVRRNHTNSNEEECKPKQEKQLRAIQSVFGGRKKQKANKNVTQSVDREENPTPRIEPPAQTLPKSVPDCEDLIDRDFNMLLFKVAKDLIMDEYQKKKNSELEENDEWLRAFEMVVKFDNAKDIRAAQLKHEEMKLESKYLKKGQAKHFKRRGLCGGDGNEAYRGEVTISDGREGGAEGECQRRSKLDHLYDLIYALRGAPRKGGWKKNQLALPSNVDQSSATQLVPVYLPWELPQNDPYSAYYTDSYGYENQGYYQQC